MKGECFPKEGVAAGEPDLPDPLLAGPVAAIDCLAGWKVNAVNAAAARLLGASPEDLAGRFLPEVLGADAGDLATPPGHPVLRQFHSLTGRRFWSFAVRIATARGHLLQLLDAAEFVQEREALAYRESIWRHAMQAAGHGVWDYNVKTDGRFYSEGWKRMRGFALDAEVCDTIGCWEARIHPDDLENVREHVRRHNAGEVSQFSFEYREQRLDGQWIWILARGRAVEWDANGVPTRLTGTDIDISCLRRQEARRAEEMAEAHGLHLAQMKEAHQAVEAARQAASDLARHDPLSGLPNRTVFAEEIARLAAGGPDGQGFAVLLIDLDRFKPINDAYGHNAGDFVLCESAQRLNQEIRHLGLAARLGGDEFGVVLRPFDDSIINHAAWCAEKIIAALSRPILFDGFELTIGASVGIALFPEHGADPEVLFRRADMALYATKHGGRAGWTFYSRQMGRRAESKAALEADLRKAVENGDIEPNFQPIVDLQTGKASALEVLARWYHPSHGQVAPDTFVPVIEQFGLMPQFTANMLRRSCAAAADWPKHVAITLNLSAREVCDLATPARLLNVLAQCNFMPGRLEIEVTEQALVQDTGLAKQVIAILRGAGIKVLLDDFGTGYSSLGYLRELKVDFLKIDRSFVSSVMDQYESGKIVDAMQSLAMNLGLKTVAEGIEDHDTCEAVRHMGCDFGQGHFFSKALRAGEVAEFLGVRPAAAKQAG